MDIIWWSIMSSCAKFQNDPFIRNIVSSKNVKRTFLLLEPLADDFSKILFYGDIVNNSTCLCAEFHGCRPCCLWGVESQRNHMSGSIRVSLAPLNNNMRLNIEWLVCWTLLSLMMMFLTSGFFFPLFNFRMTLWLVCY